LFPTTPQPLPWGETRPYISSCLYFFRRFFFLSDLLLSQTLSGGPFSLISAPHGDMFPVVFWLQSTVSRCFFFRFLFQCHLHIHVIIPFPPVCFPLTFFLLNPFSRPPPLQLLNAFLSSLAFFWLSRPAFLGLMAVFYKLLT